MSVKKSLSDVLNQGGGVSVYATLLQYVFLLITYFTATCFSRTTIFGQKYIYRKLP
jgi:hypothetical protein